MDVVTWTPETRRAIDQLFEEGLPTAEIGRRLGLTKNAVIGKLHRIALAPRMSTPVAPPQRNFFEFSGPSCLWPRAIRPTRTFTFAGRAASGEALLRRSRGGRLVRPRRIRRRPPKQPNGSSKSALCERRGTGVPQTAHRTVDASRVTGNMRSATMLRIIPMLAVAAPVFLRHRVEPHRSRIGRK